VRIDKWERLGGEKRDTKKETEEGKTKLTPWSRALLQNVKFAKFVQKSFTFHEI
jgi:hypothetical protein